MRILAKAALVSVSLLLSAGLSLAADAKIPAKAPGSAAKSTAAKENVSGRSADLKAPAKAALIDINAATDAELKAIPGVGDAFAAKIVAGRPYANKTQLKSRKILPIPLYEQIKDRIIAKQPAKAEKAAARPAGKK